MTYHLEDPNELTHLPYLTRGFEWLLFSNRHDRHEYKTKEEADIAALCVKSAWGIKVAVVESEEECPPTTRSEISAAPCPCSVPECENKHPVEPEPLNTRALALAPRGIRRTWEANDFRISLEEGAAVIEIGAADGQVLLADECFSITRDEALALYDALGEAIDQMTP